MTFCEDANAFWIRPRAPRPPSAVPVRRRGEVDSREYHLGAKDYAATTLRHNRMEAAGIHMLHWLPSTIKAEPRRVIGDLRAAIAAGNKCPPLPIKAIPPHA